MPIYTVDVVETETVRRKLRCRVRAADEFEACEQAELGNFLSDSPLPDEEEVLRVVFEVDEVDPVPAEPAGVP